MRTTADVVSLASLVRISCSVVRILNLFVTTYGGCHLTLLRHAFNMPVETLRCSLGLMLHLKFIHPKNAQNPPSPGPPTNSKFDSYFDYSFSALCYGSNPLTHNLTTSMHLIIQVDLHHSYIIRLDLHAIDMALNKVMYLRSTKDNHKDTNYPSVDRLPSKVRILPKDNMDIIIHQNRIHSNMIGCIQFFHFVCLH